MIKTVDTLTGVAIVGQAGLATNSVLENPTVQNAIIQAIVVILTAILGNIGKRRNRNNG